MVAVHEQNRCDLKKGLGLSLLLLVVLLAVSWFASTLAWDISISRLFFAEQGGWIHADGVLWRLLYAYGTVPGLLLTLGALILFVAGYFAKRWQSYRKPMLVIVLTAVIGAGLLVNGIIKPYCGRPRPVDTTAFQGQWDYCAPCFDSVPGKGMSFPCGHCTMGFLFVTLFFCRRQSAWLAYGGVTFGMAYGMLVSAARVVQGAHFFTDALWSFGVLAIVSLLLNYILIPLFQDRLFAARKFTPKQQWAMALCTFLVAGSVMAVFLTRRPYYEAKVSATTAPDPLQQIIVSTNVDLTRHSVQYSEANRVEVRLLGQGFGWVAADEEVDVAFDVAQTTLFIKVRVYPEGYFAELRHELSLTLPKEMKDRVAVEFSLE